MKSIMQGLMVLITLFACGTAWAGNVTIPNTFVAGSPAVAADVNTNFSAVGAAVNDNYAQISALAQRVAALEAVSVTNAKTNPGTAIGGTYSYVLTRMSHFNNPPNGVALDYATTRGTITMTPTSATGGTWSGLIEGGENFQANMFNQMDPATGNWNHTSSPTRTPQPVGAAMSGTYNIAANGLVTSTITNPAGLAPSSYTGYLSLGGQVVIMQGVDVATDTFEIMQLVRIAK